MGFRYLKTYNYRNLKDSKISLSANTIYLVGENGQGKTNFLEAVYLLCFGSAFRTRTDKMLITHGKEEMSVIGLLEKEGENLRINYKTGEKKRIEVNGRAVSDRKELLYNTPCILFCHEDIGFVKGSPDRKRWFLNQTIGLFDPLFIDDLRRYSRILKMRNAALKEQRKDLLDVLDLQLVSQGLVLMDKRRALAGEFSGPFGESFGEISGSSVRVELEYQPSWKEGKDPDGAMAALKASRHRDLRMGSTTTGPHRDTLGFLYQDRDYTREASTGQARLMSLIMRTAQANFYSRKTGRKPILLLDDVLLELDPVKRGRFIQAMPVYDQAIFTFLPEEHLLDSRKSETQMLSVREGQIR